jgi:hypothetical protein
VKKAIPRWLPPLPRKGIPDGRLPRCWGDCQPAPTAAENPGFKSPGDGSREQGAGSRLKGGGKGGKGGKGDEVGDRC